MVSIKDNHMSLLQDEVKVAVGKHQKYLSELEKSQVNCPGYCRVKRVMDILASLIGLALLLPLFIVVAIAILIDSRGPVIFTQIRSGKDSRVFKMYKFRSMIMDAEKDTGPIWAKDNDPRVTRVGRLLRKYRIDELPQLVNVLIGNMSIIGPRPERPSFVGMFTDIVPGYLVRTKVLPGITGPAQIKNGYDVNGDDVIRKLRYDAYYIKHMCLMFDLRIVLRTLMYLIK